MTIDNLKALCRDKMDNPIAGGMVSLIIPGRVYSNVKYFPGTRVRGEVICEYDNECLCAFDAKKLLDAIERAEKRSKEADHA